MSDENTISSQGRKSDWKNSNRDRAHLLDVVPAMERFEAELGIM